MPDRFQELGKRSCGLFQYDPAVAASFGIRVHGLGELLYESADYH
jgi:hypothetical protein